jgi:hypothetical protein
VSVVFPRATFLELNVASLDPSDALQRFEPRMAFKQTTGFAAIHPLRAEDLGRPGGTP